MPYNVTREVGYITVAKEVREKRKPEGNAEVEKEVAYDGTPENLEKLFLDFDKAVKGSKEERAQLWKKSNIVANSPQGNSGQTEIDNRNVCGHPIEQWLPQKIIRIVIRREVSVYHRNSEAAAKGLLVPRENSFVGEERDDCKSPAWERGLRPISSSDKKCMHIATGGRPSAVKGVRPKENVFHNGDDIRDN